MSDTLVAIWRPHFGARPERLLVGFAKIVFQVAAVGASPLGCEGELQILRTKSEPSAVHGAEASPISQNCNDFFEGLRSVLLHGLQRCLKLKQAQRYLCLMDRKDVILPSRSCEPGFLHDSQVSCFQTGGNPRNT